MPSSNNHLFRMAKVQGVTIPPIEDLLRMSSHSLQLLVCHILGCNYSVTPGRSCIRQIVVWAMHGFPDASSRRPQLRTAITAILCWSFPGKSMRRHANVWNLYFIAQWALGFSELRQYCSKKHHLAVMCRGFPQHLQHFVLTGTITDEWWSYCRQIELYCCDQTPKTLDSTKAWCYACFSVESDTWYVGKTKHQRTFSKACRFGPILRVSEHLSEIILGNGPQSHRQRYVHWRGISSHSIRLLPHFFSDERHIAKYELFPIRRLRPPTQDKDERTDGTIRKTPHRHRPFPRFRNLPTKKT